MLEWIWVALGGAIGACSRWAVTLGMKDGFPNYPAATLTVNLAGCFVVGLLFGWGWLTPEHPRRLLLGVGFLGSLTTFSTFGLETVSLLSAGRWDLALLNVLANVLGGVLLVGCGIWIGRGAWL